ncbi:MAG: YdiU family protein [Chitinophagaceae bacterium]|nr:YdiU family protein [Chitinophagaceae bacterium]
MNNLVSNIYKKDFVTAFEGDQSGNTRPRQTPGALYSKAVPTPVSDPALLAWSDELAAELGMGKPASEDAIDILAGNFITSTMYPYAACYAGHQFGHWAGQLGDGRAITLGEWIDAKGESWELQLKGAGPTAYSRRADGRAVLRSSLREYLMSEAMFYLGVPTTRALSLVTTGDQVLRDMFYDGHPEHEPGAIVLRVAPSFLRFGSFELLAARQETENLKKLTDWTIERFYPHITGENKYLQWYKEVVERTAVMIVEWLRVGFVHGVMNTDNMSILGLTIDYGPYSFVDDYDPEFTPNTTDLPGRRYAFGRQASVAKWNLSCLASAIAPLFEGTDQLVEALDGYDSTFWNKYTAMMADKLGLDSLRPEDSSLISMIEKAMIAIKPDMTIFYQLLITLPSALSDANEIIDCFKESFYKEPSAEASELLVLFVRQYLERMKTNTCSREESERKMRASNPRFVLRNYLLHEAIQDLGRGNNTLFLRLQEAIRNPYSDRFDQFFVRRPDWAGQAAGCSMLSCSS